jgi:hypothetical protein
MVVSTTLENEVIATGVSSDHRNERCSLGGLVVNASSSEGAPALIACGS